MDSAYFRPPNDASNHELMQVQVGEDVFDMLRKNITHGIATHMVYPKQMSIPFIDYDPLMFEYILRYLRTHEFPLFFDYTTQTFDYILYRSLLSAARHFGVKELASWIAGKKYMEEVQVTRTVTAIKDDVPEKLQKRLDILGSRAHCKVETSISWSTRKVYVCPRGIATHRNDRSQCGQACEKARKEANKSVVFDNEPVASAVVVTTEVNVKPARTLNPEATSFLPAGKVRRRG